MIIHGANREGEAAQYLGRPSEFLLGFFLLFVRAWVAFSGNRKFSFGLSRLPRTFGFNIYLVASQLQRMVYLSRWKTFQESRSRVMYIYMGQNRVACGGQLLFYRFPTHSRLVHDVQFVYLSRKKKNNTLQIILCFSFVLGALSFIRVRLHRIIRVIQMNECNNQDRVQVCTRMLEAVVYSLVAVDSLETILTVSKLSTYWLFWQL